MNGRSNKTLFAVLFAALVCIGVTAAYFTASRYANNRISIGENTIEIEEDFTPPGEMIAGENIFRKAVDVRNTGSVPCYIRVFADFSDSEIKAKSQISSDGSTFYDPDGLEWLPADWTYISIADDPLLGGFYYYTQPVDPDDHTGYLFTDVKTTFATKEEIRDYEIIVTSESVQVKDKDGADFSGSDPWRQAWEEFLGRRDTANN